MVGVGASVVGASVGGVVDGGVNGTVVDAVEAELRTKDSGVRAVVVDNRPSAATTSSLPCPVDASAKPPTPADRTTATIKERCPETWNRSWFSRMTRPTSVGESPESAGHLKVPVDARAGRTRSRLSADQVASVAAVPNRQWLAKVPASFA